MSEMRKTGSNLIRRPTFVQIVKDTKSVLYHKLSRPDSICLKQLYYITSLL